MNVDKEHVRGLEKLFLEKFKGVNRRMDSMDDALELQAKEYQRRLKGLNGEASRLRQMQETYAPREVFDRTIIDLRKDIQAIADWRKSQEGTGQGKSQILNWIPIIIQTILALLLIFAALKFVQPTVPTP